MIIEFEDKGQDFLRWTLDNNGVVTESAPYQSWMWVGYRVINHAQMKPGMLVQVITPTGTRTSMKYLCKAVTP